MKIKLYICKVGQFSNFPNCQLWHALTCFVGYFIPLIIHFLFTNQEAEEGIPGIDGIGIHYVKIRHEGFNINDGKKISNNYR